MSVYNTITFAVDGAVATLTLNRPDRLNALNAEMACEIYEAMQVVARDLDIRALILTGTGQFFCSESDPGDLAPRDSDDAEQNAQTLFFAALTSVSTSRVPVIIAVNGPAVGEGYSLALCGDLLLAAREANFVQGLRGVNLGPALGPGNVPAMIGRPHSRNKIMTCEVMSAEQALQWGVINECLDIGQLLPRARALAATLAQGPTRALMMTRRLLDEGAANSFEAQYRRELEVNSELRECCDGIEGVKAFLEKRSPQFRGE